MKEARSSVAAHLRYLELELEFVNLDKADLAWQYSQESPCRHNHRSYTPLTHLQRCIETGNKPTSSIKQPIDLPQILPILPQTDSPSLVHSSTSSEEKSCIAKPSVNVFRACRCYLRLDIIVIARK